MVPLHGRVTRICHTLSPPRAVPQLSLLVTPGGDSFQGRVQKQVELEVLGSLF